MIPDSICFQAGMDVSHHGGSAYYDSSTMDGVKPQNGVTKHSPNGVESEVIMLL